MNEGIEDDVGVESSGRDERWNREMEKEEGEEKEEEEVETSDDIVG